MKENNIENIKKKCTKIDILAKIAKGISFIASTYAKGEKHKNSLILLKMEFEKKRYRWSIYNGSPFILKIKKNF